MVNYSSGFITILTLLLYTLAGTLKDNAVYADNNEIVSQASDKQKEPAIANIQEQHHHHNHHVIKHSAYQTTHIANKPRVCPGVHIRNDLKSFEQLRGCNVIDGPLTIALVKNKTKPYESKDYDRISFPDLLEIREYLLLYRVEGISTLEKLFPNLAVIRGEKLVSNYALIIYELMHLQRINLYNLTDILSGSVRIVSNPNLCHVSTVNWGAICKKPYIAHLIKDNNARCHNTCPDNCQSMTNINSSSIIEGDNDDYQKLGSGNDPRKYCWSNQHCQNPCDPASDGQLARGPDGKCCHIQCAGGCYSSGRSDSCFACRNVMEGRSCVANCSRHLYEYKTKCITKQECISLVEHSHHGQNCPNDRVSTRSNFKAIEAIADEKHGQCQTSCPPGSEEDPMNKNGCKKCDKGKCRKVCTPQNSEKEPYMVTNINSLREMRGCNVINGSLEIAMKGGNFVLRELSENFRELEEIKGYLKITRSYPIVDLSFLSKLKTINGSQLDRGQYSLIIIDNPNLQELFVFNKSDSNETKLSILEGKIFVHLNPKLCPHRIDNLKTYASVAEWDDNDVSRHTNGDKEICSTEKIDVQLVSAQAQVAWIRFQNFALEMPDPRSLLYYLINYREAPHGNVTMFDGKDGCNSQNDVWMTKEESPLQRSSSGYSDKYQESVISVKPATRYALYIKTFTILTNTKGALSDIIYFETAPDTPGIPKQLTAEATGTNSIRVKWHPPSKPKGIIDRYVITITATNLEGSYSNDLCQNEDLPKPIPRTKKNEQENTNNRSKTPQKPQSNSEEETQTCKQPSSEPSDSDPSTRLDDNNFQDLVIDFVFIKPSCPAGGESGRSLRKRSIDNEINGPRILSLVTTPKLDRDYSIMTKRPETKNSSSPESSQPVISTPILKFDRSNRTTKFNITADRQRPTDGLSYTITGLDHYTQYYIDVAACHGEFNSKTARPPQNYERCGTEALTQVFTDPIPEYDRIYSSSILFQPFNESLSNDFIITWSKPERPNGILLFYRVRYRLKNGNPDVWTEACVTNAAYNSIRGFILRGLSPGNYLMNVQAVTTYQSRLWSEPYEFEIPPENPMSKWILTSVIILLIAIVFAVAMGTYSFQKKRHELANGLVYASVNPEYIQYEADEWEVDMSNLEIGSQIGNGSFGIIFKGKLISEKGSLNCAIKTVPPTATAKQRVDFLREASIMKQFDTYHVVKLMGVVSTSSPVYVIMEYMEKGDLREYLRSLREAYEKAKKPLVDGVYLMAAQIADGMAYLASKKFVHRDLAARNCMVGENNIVKIGDFGLARDIYANDYYRRGTQALLPVRWMAPESLKDNIYTSASDVWSFGVVLWELVTFSAHPYAGWSNEEVCKRVERGLTMPRPENCTDKLYYIMEGCWRMKDYDRPSFESIVEYLLSETGDKFYPNCFYRKKVDGDSFAHQIPDENHSGTESFALLSWPSNNRANGLTNGFNQKNSEINEKKIPLP